ncbi:MAG: hypothetical protein ACLUOF_06820 [Ruminococcus sp.]
MYCNGTLDDLKYGEFFLFTTDRDHSKNNITNVAPGETVEATVAFLMDADELQDLYADILGYGQKTIVSWATYSKHIQQPVITSTTTSNFSPN